jgi:hypothetical protein
LAIAPHGVIPAFFIRGLSRQQDREGVIMYKFNLAILALVLVLGLAFVGCSNDVKDPAEQAFEDVRKNFGNPKTDSWQQDNAEFTRFFFHEESFISADLQAVRTYWNSLPKVDRVK